jgi:hypothetical protein
MELSAPVARFAEEIALAKRFIPGEIKTDGERFQNPAL